MNHTEFINKLKKSPRPAVVDFWAPWCGPCRMIEPALGRLEQKYAGNVDLIKINADEHPELLRALKIYGIPTQIVFQDGKEITRKTGAQPERAIESLFEAALSGEEPVNTGLGFVERLLRIAAALLLFFLAYSGPSILLGVLGGIVFFSAVYDRCPVWKVVAPKIKSLLNDNT